MFKIAEGEKTISDEEIAKLHEQELTGPVAAIRAYDPRRLYTQASNGDFNAFMESKEAVTTGAR